jgi:hypothetical protein
MVQASEATTPTTEETVKANRHNYSIAKQPLYSALSALAEQAGVQFVYSAEMVKTHFAGCARTIYRRRGFATGIVRNRIAFAAPGRTPWRWNTISLFKKPAAASSAPEKNCRLTIPSLNWGDEGDCYAFRKIAKPGYS